MNDNIVIAALRNSKKGRLPYDRYWEEEGRTREVLDKISEDLKRISISPKALLMIKLHDHSYCKPESIAKKSPDDQPSRRLKAAVKKTNDDVIYLESAFVNQLPILEYEEERKQATQNFHNAKKKEYEAFDLGLSHEMEKQYLNIKKQKQQEAFQEAARLEKYEQELKEALLKKNLEKQHVENEKLKVEEAKKCLEKQKNDKLEQQLQSQLKEYEEKILFNLIKMKQALTGCQQKYLTTSVPIWVGELSRLLSSLGDIVKASKCSNLTTESITNLQSILLQSEDLFRCLLIDIEHAKLIAMKAEEIQKTEELRKTEDVRTTGEFQRTNELKEPEPKPEFHQPNISVKPNEIISRNIEHKSSIVNTIATEETIEAAEVEIDDMEESEVYNEGKEKLAMSVNPAAFRNYCNIMQNLKKVESSFEQFKMNPKHKKYRLELHKAVAVNTISDASGLHLKAKITHLSNLLSGQTVESGGKYISCKHDPAALNYCKNLLAEKIVTQGEEQVRSKVDSAFPFAVVTVALCSRFPDLWQLILGHFYLRCPYLVPYYPEQEENQSEADYYSNLGYKYVDGKREETTNFLKRMHGFVTLYGAIVQTDPLGSLKKRSHGLEHGWMYMAHILNLDPRPDITASVLLAFLEVVGHSLGQTYDKQFKKILHIICKDYFQKIKQINASGGPVGRLKDFLHNSITRGSIARPDGILPSHFWRT